MGKYYLMVLAALFFVIYPSPTVSAPVHSGYMTQERVILPVAQAATVQSPIERYAVWVTAYSSTPEETDDSPFITARGTEVRDGIVAANFLPFGTKIRIPELFGDTVFTVEDRMHNRKKNFVDIWMSSQKAAQSFGIYYTDIIVIE